MIWLREILGSAWGYILAALAAVGIVVVARKSGESAGRNEVVAETAKKEVESVKTAAEVDRQVLTAKPDDKRARLRDSWTRD